MRVSPPGRPPLAFRLNRPGCGLRGAARCPSLRGAHRFRIKVGLVSRGVSTSTRSPRSAQNGPPVRGHGPPVTAAVALPCQQCAAGGVGDGQRGVVEVEGQDQVVVARPNAEDDETSLRRVIVSLRARCSHGCRRRRPISVLVQPEGLAGGAESSGLGGKAGRMASSPPTRSSLIARSAVFVAVVDRRRSAQRAQQHQGVREVPGRRDLAGQPGDVVVADERQRDEGVEVVVVPLAAPRRARRNCGRSARSRSPSTARTG